MTKTLNWYIEDREMDMDAKTFIHYVKIFQTHWLSLDQIKEKYLEDLQQEHGIVVVYLVLKLILMLFYSQSQIRQYSKLNKMVRIPSEVILNMGRYLEMDQYLEMHLKFLYQTTAILIIIVNLNLEVLTIFHREWSMNQKQIHI